MNTSLPLRPVDAGFFVAAQLGPEHMAEVAALGFRSVVNNRPDFEAGPEQPTDAAVRVAAEAAGLTYRYLPVAPGHHSPDEIAAMAALLDELPGPVLAYCRSGARSTRLYVAALQLRD
jgi:uncharacterized protein (TIGR01244 family)